MTHVRVGCSCVRVTDCGCMLWVISGWCSWLVFAVRARVCYVLCRGIMYSVWVRVVRMALVMLSMRVNDMGCVCVWVSG